MPARKLLDACDTRGVRTRVRAKDAQSPCALDV